MPNVVGVVVVVVTVVFPILVTLLESVVVDESKFIVLLNAESSIVIAKLTIPFVSSGLTVYCAVHSSPEPLYVVEFVTS